MKSKFNTSRTKGADMKCQHPFPVPNAIGNSNLWRFLCPVGGHPKLYENGWEIPCFFACGRRKRGRPYPFPHGRPGGDTGAQNHRNEHFSKPTEGGIQHGGKLVLSDKLFEHCAEIDEAARNRMELIVPELAKQYGVTEQLKAENQMEWVRQMNACKAQAEEIVKFELIYD